MRQAVRMVWIVLLLAGLAGTALAGQASEAPGACPLPRGQAFPDVHLAGTLTAAQAACLGLASTRTPIPIGDIRAEVLIVEVFSMYCPFCQKEAPVVNELRERIASRGLADRIKIIGLGVGNSDLEVDVFRKKYGVSFPLFSDADFTVHKAVGQVGTPYFYVLRRTDGGPFAVLESNLGCMASPEAFLDSILRALGR